MPIIVEVLLAEPSGSSTLASNQNAMNGLLSTREVDDIDYYIQHLLLTIHINSGEDIVDTALIAEGSLRAPITPRAFSPNSREPHIGNIVT